MCRGARGIASRPRIRKGQRPQVVESGVGAIPSEVENVYDSSAVSGNVSGRRVFRTFVMYYSDASKAVVWESSGGSKRSVTVGAAPTGDEGGVVNQHSHLLPAV